MNATQSAKRAYTSHFAPIRTDRGSEYDAFAKVTQKLQSAMVSAMKAKSEGRKTFKTTTMMTEALHLNRKLWTLLASDVLKEGNLLPNELRASILSLNAFTNSHSSKVLRGEASIQPLIEINAAIMRGLNGGDTRP